ncbi:serine hydrolase domain-containing protein [Pseudoalteromonas sp. SMS1]|uniref:serine hydrolase domain-containing protein n=1 Tax=Pseudoalteromonas sp. SMS1 TaxID=2908894 RepID=UPI001F45EE06|nr:beta-lactamase family protein [Pseudoalteromonas sp. SMS1]
MYDNLTSSLEDTRVQNSIPAMSVAIITSGKVTYIKGFGFLDKAQKIATDPNTLYRIASITKLFTAQAIMHLVEKNKISLNDRIGLYLPSFSDSEITIKQLLTHSSGLEDVIKPVNFERKRTISAYLDLVSENVLSYTGNNDFLYSDANYNILGAIISSVSGMNYEAYVYTNILIPSEMNDSGFYNVNNSYFSKAKPTYKGKLIDKGNQRPYDLSFNPSEGLLSSVYDLSLWLELTLARDPSLLKAQTYKDMLAPQVKTVWGQIDMGLGWQVYKESNVQIARHPGSIRGYKSLVLTYPDSKNALIILTNSSNTPRWEIAKLITKHLKSHNVW